MRPSALLCLRDVVGPDPSDDLLKALLRASGDDVERAANAFHDAFHSAVDAHCKANALVAQRNVWFR